MTQLSAQKRELLKRLLHQQDVAAPRVQQIPRRSGAAVIPVSGIQERMLRQTDPEHPAYNIRFAFYLDGPLCVAALESSLKEILRRHDAWRTTFATHNGRFVQRVASSLDLVLTRVELGGLPPDEQEAKVSELANDHAGLRFSLHHGPLVRATLLRLHDRRHALLLSVHHIVSDGWSTGLFTKELSALYRAVVAGEPAKLPDLPIQYADFAHWEHNRLAAGELDDQRAYWQEQLEGVPELILPLDRPRPSLQTYAGGGLRLTFPRDLSERVRLLCQKTGASLFMLLLAVFKALLHRYSSQEDLVIGVPVANRSRIELEPLLACCINFLPLRTRLDGDRRFLDLLQRVREVCLGAYAHPDLPYCSQVDLAGAEWKPSHHPLFQVMFEVVAPLHGSKLDMPGLTPRPLEFDHGTSEFDLSLIVVEGGPNLTGWLLYKAALFDVATVARIGRDYEAILTGITERPESRLSELPLQS